MTLLFHSSRETHWRYRGERSVLRVHLSCPLLNHDQGHGFVRLPGIKNGLVQSHSTDPRLPCGLNYDHPLPACHSPTKRTQTPERFRIPPQPSSGVRSKMPRGIHIPLFILGKLMFQQDHNVTSHVLGSWFMDFSNSSSGKTKLFPYVFPGPECLNDFRKEMPGWADLSPRYILTPKDKVDKIWQLGFGLSLIEFYADN